jgi:hypothetical protein
MSSVVYVYTMSRTGEVGAWSRYVFPFNIDHFCQKGDDLYIRAGNDVLKVDQTSTTDFADDIRSQPFTGTVQWPWLDFGQPGQQKQMIGLDVSVSRGSTVVVQLGTNQNSPSAFTAGYTIPSDTVPGTLIPIPIMAPSISLRLTFSSFDDWQLQSATLYFNDQRLTAGP